MFNDLRYAARAFFKTPGFTVVAILTLALGIGTNTAIFSVVNGVLLRPLPYPHTREIVQVWSTSAGEPKAAHAPADFLEFQRDNRTLLALAGYREDALTIIPPRAEPVRVSGALVTTDYFDVFGMPAVVGRTFSRSIDGSADEPLVVLSHAAWAQYFSADPQIVNRRVRINGVAHTVVGVMPASFAYPDGKHQAAFYQRVLEGLEQRPETEAAAILFPSPIEGANASGSFTLEGQASSSRADRPRTSIASVSANYFRTLGIPIITGRTFTEQDREPAPAVAIVNATFARKYFAGQSPLGKRVRFGDSGDDWITLIAVVGDSRNVGLHEPPTPLLYMPYHSFTLPFMAFAIRSTAPTATISSLARTVITNADPELPVDKIQTLGDVLKESVAEPRFRTVLLGAFALMAVILAAVGVYGLISYSVTQRTREIGIRMALGAQARQVMLPVLREGLTLALAGIAIGLAGSVAISRVLKGFLFGIDATDPLTYCLVALLLLAVALTASYIPSRRALRVDPITALRAE